MRSPKRFYRKASADAESLLTGKRIVEMHDPNTNTIYYCLVPVKPPAAPKIKPLQKAKVNVTPFAALEQARAVAHVDRAIASQNDFAREANRSALLRANRVATER